jgi:hypothetical protein
VGLALLAAAQVEVRVGACTGGRGRPVAGAPTQVVDGRLERAREALQSAGAERDEGGVFEVLDVVGMHLGATGDLVVAEAELAAAVGDAAGEVACARGHRYVSSPLEAP